MKKIILTLLIWLTFVFNWAFSIDFNVTDENDFPYDVDTSNDWVEKVLDKALDENKDFAKDIVWEESLQNKSPIIYYISKVINYFLAILAFMSFIVLAFWLTKVFTVNNTDAEFKKAWKYIWASSVAIVIIWISWLFSMWVFNIYNMSVAK